MIGRAATVAATSWRIQLPFTRPLSLNDRMHHMAKARAVREWRTAAHWAIKAAGIPPCARIWVELHYVPAQNRRRDPDNLVASFKPVVDALVDAGVIPDDTQVFVDRAWPVIDPAEPKRQGGRFYLLLGLHPVED
jgi:crossover junction endodeoxyribonuclease RusA